VVAGGAGTASGCRSGATTGMRAFVLALAFADLRTTTFFLAPFLLGALFFRALAFFLGMYHQVWMGSYLPLGRGFGG
jgi:hypothetical protein